MNEMRKATPTTETHLEADAEAGLHDLAHGLIGQVGPHRSQEQRPQDLEDREHTAWVEPDGVSLGMEITIEMKLLGRRKFRMYRKVKSE